MVFSVIAECVLAPASGPAPLPGEVGECVWQTGRAYVRVTAKVDRLVHAKYGQVIIQRAGIEFPVNDHAGHVRFYVREELHVVVDVPFAKTDAQVLFVIPAVIPKYVTDGVVRVTVTMVANNYSCPLPPHCIMLVHAVGNEILVTRYQRVERCNQYNTTQCSFFSTLQNP